MRISYLEQSGSIYLICSTKRKRCIDGRKLARSRSRPFLRPAGNGAEPSSIPCNPATSISSSSKQPSPRHTSPKKLFSGRGTKSRSPHSQSPSAATSPACAYMNLAWQFRPLPSLWRIGAELERLPSAVLASNGPRWLIHDCSVHPFRLLAFKNLTQSQSRC